MADKKEEIVKEQKDKPRNTTEHETKEEDQGSLHDISELQQQRISAEDIRILRNAGYYTVESIAYTPRKEIVAVEGISEVKADKLQFAGICVFVFTFIAINIFRYIQLSNKQHVNY